MKKDMIQKRFQELSEQLKEVESTRYTSESWGTPLEYVDDDKFTQWKMKTKQFLKTLCGVESEYYQTFLEKETAGFVGTTNFQILQKLKAVFEAVNDDFEKGHLPDLESFRGKDDKQDTKQIKGEKSMKILISWSGKSSKALAELLGSWLPFAIPEIKPWISSSSISLGARWGKELAETLDETNFGILCLTAESIRAPWVLFEAGALSKSVEDGKIIPLLLGIETDALKDSPLGQFQGECVNEAGIKKLVKSIVAEVANTPERELDIEKKFSMLWAGFKDKLAKIEIAEPQDNLEANEDNVPKDLFVSDDILWSETTYPDGGKIYQPYCPSCKIPMKRKADFVDCSKCGYKNFAPQKPSSKTEPVQHTFGRNW